MTTIWLAIAGVYALSARRELRAGSRGWALAAWACTLGCLVLAVVNL